MGSGALEFGRTIKANRPLQLLHPPAPYLFEDFLVDVLADTPYITVAQSGTPITAAAISATAGDPIAGHGGWLAGSTDDVDAEIDEVAVGGSNSVASAWQANAVGAGGILVCEWGLTIPAALTARQYFAGLTDDPLEGTGTNGPLNIAGTTVITDVATDAAGFIFSSLATNPTIWKFGATDSGTQDTATDTGLTAVANTWAGLRVEVDVNGDAYFFVRRVRGGSLEFQGKSANGLSPDVPLVPVFTAAPTTTTTVPWEVDYAFVSASHAV